MSDREQRVPASDEVAILLCPHAAYRDRARLHVGGWWIAARRPLLTALLLGSAVSLLTTGSLTLRLVAGGALVWSFVPLLETAAFALVWRKGASTPSFSRALDLFFAGRGAWLLATIALAAAAAFATPLQVYGWSSMRGGGWVLPGLLAVIAWSARVDLAFFQVVMERPRGQAWRLLLLQRAVCWSAVVAYFFGFPLWPLIATRLHR